MTTLLRLSVSALCAFVLAILPAHLQAGEPPLAPQVVPPFPVDDGSTPPTALPVTVAPNDPKLRYDGRFVVTDKSATCSWPASAVMIAFHGTAINAGLNIGGNYIEVMIDGQPTKAIMSATKTGGLYSLASGLTDADHIAFLCKRSEANAGKVELTGFQLNQGATVLPAPAVTKRIEVIGDSISCGLGNEGADRKDKLIPQKSNAYLAYGALTARTFGAAYGCYAWSGRKLWPDNTTPSIYPFVLPGDPASPKWDFAQQKPDVVLINLATNEFTQKDAAGKEFAPPDPEGWIKAYHEFLGVVRANYPDATIYLAMGPMLNDVWPPGLSVQTKARTCIQRVVKETNDKGDAKVHFLEFPPQGFDNGMGSGYHPSLKTHQLMSDRFAAAIETDLGWKPVAKAP